MPTPHHRKSLLATRRRERQPSGEPERLLTGVRLERSELGGKAVHYCGEFVGWLHSNGSEWNTYVRIPGKPVGEKLGTFPLKRAVAEILRARGSERP